MQKVGIFFDFKKHLRTNSIGKEFQMNSFEGRSQTPRVCKAKFSKKQMDDFQLIKSKSQNGVTLLKEVQNNKQVDMMIPQEPNAEYIKNKKTQFQLKKYTINVLVKQEVKQEIKQEVKQEVNIKSYSNLTECTTPNTRECTPTSPYSPMELNQRRRTYYKGSLIECFNKKKKMNNIQRQHLLHFTQSFSQVQAKNDFPPPEIEYIQEKVVILPENRLSNLFYKPFYLLNYNLKEKKSLFLDLDETLVHCTDDLSEKYDFIINLNQPDGKYKLGVKKRPYLQKFLQEMNELYEIIVFTASDIIYANAIISKIDPERKYIQHLFARENCIYDRGHFIKDLRIFKGRSLDQMIIVDNSTQSFIYQLENGIPIISFYNDEDDQELYQLSEFLKYNQFHQNFIFARSIHNDKDIRTSLEQQFGFTKLINYENIIQAKNHLFK